MVDASEDGPLTREDLARQINKWELDGLAQVKASQVRQVCSFCANGMMGSRKRPQRYFVLPGFAGMKARLGELAEKLSKQMEEKEEGKKCGSTKKATFIFQ